MWKIFAIMCVVLGTCHAQSTTSTTTTSPISNRTSGVEKEDDLKIPNTAHSIRMMPFMRQPSNQPAPDTRNPGAPNHMTNPRMGYQVPAYIPQSSTPSYPNPENRNRAAPSQGTRQGRQNTPENGSSYQDPRTENGYRADRQVNSPEMRFPITNREDENGIRPQTGARSSEMPGILSGPQEARVPSGYLGQPQYLGDANDALGPVYRGIGGEAAYDTPYYPQPSTQSRRQFEGEQGTRPEDRSASRAAPPIGSQQPAARRGTPSDRQQPGVSRSIPVVSRDPEPVQPRYSGQPINDNAIFPPGQGPRVGYDGTWTSYRRYGVDSQDPGVLYRAPEEHQHRAYSFNYLSESDDGMHGHQQTADESGKVIGSYAISLEDGRKRVVEYIADENGFRASIDTNEPGTNSDVNPADVVYYNTPGHSGRRAPFQGMQDGQNQRRVPGSGMGQPSVLPTRTNIPVYRSQETQQGPRTAAGISEDSENRVGQPIDVGRGVPRYDASPRLPLRRRLQDTEDEGSRYLRPPQAVSPAVSSRARVQGNLRNVVQPAEEDVNAPTPEERGMIPARAPEVPRSQDPSEMPRPYGGRRPQIDRVPAVPVYRNAQPDVVDAEPSTYVAGRPAEDSFVNSSPNGGSNDDGNRFWFHRY